MNQSELADYQPADHTDPEWLRKRYHGDLLTIDEMAAVVGKSYTAVRYQMEKHGIGRRSKGQANHLTANPDGDVLSEVHRDKDWLKRKYFEEKLSVDEMADEAGVVVGAISQAMDDYNITRRPSHVTRILRDPDTGFCHAAEGGYEQLRNSDGDETCNFQHHRLLAMAYYGIGPVKSGVVHHKNGIPWDNRPDNLELLESQSEHARLHQRQRSSSAE